MYGCPQELHYLPQALTAIGEVVGTVSKGLSEQALASLPTCKASSVKEAGCTNCECAVCRMEYGDDDALTLLPCKHHYHADCIQQWLTLNKVCVLHAQSVAAELHDNRCARCATQRCCSS